MYQLIPCLIALLATVTDGRAETGPPPLMVLSGSHIEIHGRSNVNRWKCTAPKVEGALKGRISPRINPQLQTRLLDPNATKGFFDEQTALLNRRIDAGKVSLKVKDLQCPNATMRRDLMEALNADEHPGIAYQVKDIATIGPAEGLAGKRALNIQVNGELTMAGTTRDLELVVIASQLGNGGFRLVSNTRILMSDYGVTPPTALFGAIRAHDEVLLHFDILLGHPPLQGEQTSATTGTKGQHLAGLTPDG